MATLADSLRTSSGRPLLLRKRPDLEASEQRYQGMSFWVVKEPVGLKYFRFQEEEYFILQLLEGEISLDEIKEQFESRFAPQKITLGDLQQFIGTLHRGGLVLAESQGQGEQLKRRRDERKRKERMGMWTNILAIRFKGFDPERILNGLLPLVRWFFHPFTQLLVVMMALSALLLITVQFDVFQSKLPGFQEFFGPENWLTLACVLGITKMMHEFGHGLSCKYFGGECHEIGVMFLVLTPCLYCNVSDSWMLPSKWKRAAIGAAGMYVELVLASLATFGWWMTTPGLFNHVCLQIMFVCSVSTIVFNGNPLLRYDGYYILSDLVEIPNLRQKASTILNQMMAKKCLGLELPEQPFLPQRNRAFFALYTVASVAYRWFVLFTILFFLYQVFEPYGLKPIGQAIAFFSISTLIGKPMWGLFKFMKAPGRKEQVKRKNLLSTMAVVGAVVVAILFVPLPRRVNCSLEIRSRDAKLVYVKHAGVLEKMEFDIGDPVRAGDVLARLSNLDLDLEILRLEGELQVSIQKEASLRRLDLQFHDESFNARDQIEQLQENITSLEKKIAVRVKQREQLLVTAQIDGTIMPASRQGSPAGEGQLRTWTGRATHPQNLHALLSERDTICEIGDPNCVEAALIIDQTDIDLVSEGMTVEIMLEAYPGKTFTCQIDHIALVDLDEAPRSLSNMAGGELATRTDAAGNTKPASASYIASVPIDIEDGRLQVGLRGDAQIHTGYQPLAGRIWRYLSHTLNFVL